MPFSPRSLALTALLALALVLPAAAQAASPFAPLQKALTAAGPKLGKGASASIRRHAKRAARDYRSGQICPALHELGAIVDATRKLKGDARVAGAPVAGAARRLQRRIFLRRAARHGACGLRKPTFKVSKAVKPQAASFAGQPVARIADDHGGTTDFVANRLVVRTTDKAKLDAFAARWHGKVVASRAPTYLVQVDAADAPTGGLVADVRRLDPTARGRFAVSSDRGLGLIAVAADAAAHGLTVAPDFLAPSTGLLDGNTTEQTGLKNFPTDAFTISYNKSTGPDAMGTGEAWRDLLIAGKTGNRVKLGIIDGGFSTQTDFPANTVGADGKTNQMQCTGGNPCPWHGTEVASTAAAVVDNSDGVAGSGGQIADLVFKKYGGDEFGLIDAIYDELDAGAKVINISSGWGLVAIVSEFNIPIEDATQTARERGTLVVASAGNDGKDVDAQDCFIVCWEEEWIAPCENDAVLCVGGLDTNGKRAAKSNYGYESCDDAQSCDVDVFGPWTTWVGPDPANKFPRMVSGTSFASPYVAGVAAMMLAADPSLTPGGLENGLKATARSVSDKTVSRVVDADGAVRWALSDHHTPPAIEFTSPAPGTQIPYGGFNLMHFALKTFTLYSDATCCVVSLTSDQDGFLGTSSPGAAPFVDAVLSKPGKHTVTATATDGQGATATATIQVEAYNVNPKLDIAAPKPGSTVYRGQTVKFAATPSDVDEPGGPACTSVHWSVTPDGSQAEEAAGDGCQPAFTFNSNGKRNLAVHVKDAAGGGATYHQDFTVVDPPLNAPPLVTILSPDDNAALDPGTTIQLKAAATDPDNGSTVTGTWSVKVNGGTKVLGAGNTRSWKPGDDVPFHCGGNDATLVFSATDNDGTSTAQVDVHVNYGPC